MQTRGEEPRPSDIDLIDVTNPATGELVGRVPAGIPGDVSAAVDNAEDAFGEWSGRTDRDRGRLLFLAAQKIRERHRDLARLLTMEQGKPLQESVDEVRGFCAVLEFYAGISSSPAGDAIRLGKQGDCMVIREPLGVCGAIVPWNMPVLIMGWKAGPALLAGNTLVLKPSSLTPLTSLRIASLMEESGIPHGVLNIVTGRGETVGEALVRHPGVRKISFTGDYSTGCRIRELAAGRLADVSLELGGSDPMIVMDDVRIPDAVDGAVRGRFYNAGQTCTAVKRLYVHEKIADPFIRELKARVDAVTVGNGLLPQTRMGPMVSGIQREKISELVESARENGEGRVISGGSAPGGAGLEKGFFYLPTLMTDVPPDSSLLAEEVFGPLLPVMVVSDLDSAIREANRSRFGLGASVWTRDLGTVRRVFREVNAGIIWVNRHLTVPPEIPFGGQKASGDTRENGYHALAAYTRTKTLLLGW
jgi:betaine-aldehyde dehydrogenase